MSISDAQILIKCNSAFAIFSTTRGFGGIKTRAPETMHENRGSVDFGSRYFTTSYTSPPQSSHSYIWGESDQHTATFNNLRSQTNYRYVFVILSHECVITLFLDLPPIATLEAESVFMNAPCSPANSVDSEEVDQLLDGE